MTKKQSICEWCGEPHIKEWSGQTVCCQLCADKSNGIYSQPPRKLSKYKPPSQCCYPGISTGTIGAIAELAVANDLMMNGWSVFRAISQSCFCDLIAYKEDITRKIEVRTAIKTKTGKLSFPGKISAFATEYALYVHKTKEIVYLAIQKENP